MDFLFDSTAMEFTRSFLALFYTFVAAFYTVRIISLKRATGGEHVFHGRFLSANWWHHKIFGVFRVTIWMVCVFRWLFPAIDDYLGLLPGSANPILLLVGDLMLFVGFTWVILVHCVMGLGRSWTSGVSEQGPQRLVTTGFYGFSRNPIYMGVLTAQIGFALALPSVFSVVCLLVGVTIILRQAKLEERHLFSKFPQQYALYQQQVRRWI